MIPLLFCIWFIFLIQAVIGTSKNSSPLLLDGIFDCSSSASSEPAAGVEAIPIRIVFIIALSLLVAYPVVAVVGAVVAGTIVVAFNCTNIDAIDDDAASCNRGCRHHCCGPCCIDDIAAFFLKADLI